MTATADRILDVMQDLIQTRGFSAISYQHISDALKVTKASIHYHFPSKSDLGTAVVRRYRAMLMAMMEAVADDETRSTWDILTLYFGPYLEFADTPDKVCLCGALAGEYPALPPDMQAEVAGFFAEQQSWLERLIERGGHRGELRSSASAAETARLVFSALQGALLVQRAGGDARQLTDVITGLRGCVTTDPY